jgi:iron complex transport system ATP-binding protein
MFRAPDPLLRLEGVHVALGGRTILRQVGFAVERGAWIGLLGPNGSGKTTLLRALSGALPYDGDIRFEGRPLRTWRPQHLARHLAFVRQATPLVFDFTVEDLVLLGRSPHKRWLEAYTAQDRDLLAHALAAFELDGFAGRSVLSLSGGELQRVFLAQAFVQEAALLLLDEPTAHLDVRHQFEFLEQVRALVAAGRTVIAVFHDLELAARYAHHVLVLQEGRLVAAGPPAEVLSEALIASVFRMRAACTQGADGTLRIHYVAPLAPVP